MAKLRPLPILEHFFYFFFMDRGGKRLRGYKRDGGCNKNGCYTTLVFLINISYKIGGGDGTSPPPSLPPGLDARSRPDDTSGFHQIVLPHGVSSRKMSSPTEPSCVEVRRSMPIVETPAGTLIVTRRVIVGLRLNRRESRSNYQLDPRSKTIDVACRHQHEMCVLVHIE